ncbi:hypothetical protein ACHAXS_006758 [Conticribra weissflogii]
MPSPISCLLSTLSGTKWPNTSLTSKPLPKAARLMETMTSPPIALLQPWHPESSSS